MEEAVYYNVVLVGAVTEEEFYRGMDFVIAQEALDVFLKFAFDNNYKAIIAGVAGLEEESK
jgi:hypothetical protein